MRADRLLSIVLLLQHRGRMSASALASELEVSTRTVLRDVEALSGAGIPVYAERGRAGGFALLPGFSTDLTGLTSDEALALLVAGSRSSSDSVGMALELASAMRKVVAALPQPHRAQATRHAERVLVRREGFVPRVAPAAEVADELLAVVRHAVFAGRRLRIRYAARAAEPQWRTVDPVGLVEARGAWYLLALRDGAERTYRLSRMLEADALDEPAERPTDVDLEKAWLERRARFGAQLPRLAVRVRVRTERRADLGEAALAVTSEAPDGEGWVRLDLVFAEPRHAEGVLWSFVPDVEVLEPADLRATLAERSTSAARIYAPG